MIKLALQDFVELLFPPASTSVAWIGIYPDLKTTRFLGFQQYSWGDKKEDQFEIKDETGLHYKFIKYGKKNWPTRGLTIAAESFWVYGPSALPYEQIVYKLNAKSKETIVALNRINIPDENEAIPCPKCGFELRVSLIDISKDSPFPSGTFDEFGNEILELDPGYIWDDITEDKIRILEESSLYKQENEKLREIKTSLILENQKIPGLESQVEELKIKNEKIKELYDNNKKELVNYATEMINLLDIIGLSKQDVDGEVIAKYSRMLERVRAIEEESKKADDITDRLLEIREKKLVSPATKLEDIEKRLKKTQSDLKESKKH